MDKIEKGDIFVYKSKYDSYEYFVTVESVKKIDIITSTYNAIEYDIISDKGIRFKIGELTKVTKILNDEEIIERKAQLDKFNNRKKSIDLSHLDLSKLTKH